MSEKQIIFYTPPDKAVKWVIGVTVWTGRHAHTAVGSRGGPHVVTFFRIYLPPLLSFNDFARTIRDGSRRTNPGTLLTELTKMKDGSVGNMIFIGERHIGGNY